MIRAIVARNVNEALSEGFWWLKTSGILDESRNGSVIVAPDPVVTTYLRPQERILWDEERDANPFFHLMEAIWMMAGRSDVEWVAQFNSRMREYAEPDGRIHGAYGNRWRKHFGFDQLVDIVHELKTKPHTRQAVLSMWEPHTDLRYSWKDKPCNTTVYFRVNAAKYLDMTVCCRSNDILWGAYGANAVHFSILQEVVAWFAGYNVGQYHQFSNNYHAYLGVPQAARFLQNPPAWGFDPYRSEEVSPTPIFNKKEDGNGIQAWLDDCARFCEDDPCDNQFLVQVATPMREYYLRRKDDPRASDILAAMPQSDWKLAAQRWGWHHRVQGD